MSNKKSSGKNVLDTDLSVDSLGEKLSDRWWRLNNLYWIRDIKGDKIKFHPNWAQKELYNDLWYYNVILKVRQLGVTTFFCILFLDDTLFNGHDSGLIAHTEKLAKKIFKTKIQFAFNNLPKPLRQKFQVKSKTKTQMEFDVGGRESSIYTGVSLRSGTLQNLHVSEMATIDQKFPDKATEIKSGAMNTVHEGVITVESTAKGACYDNKTEILTKEGWKYFRDLNQKDSILTRDKSGNAYYQDKWIYYQSDYEGEMYKFYSDKLDLKVTPEHKMWVQRQKGPWQFIKAKDLYHRKTDLNFKKTFNWKGEKKDSFYLPSYEIKNYTGKGYSKILEEKKIRMSDWLEFLGYFLTEGNCFYKQGNKGIKITQKRFPEKMIAICKKIAKQIGANCRIYEKDKTYRIYILNAQLADYLKNYCHPKRIPNDILELDKESLLILFEAIYLGDGDKGKRKQGDSDFGRIYVGEYEELADDYQKLVLKLGYSSTKTKKKKGNCWIVRYSEKQQTQLKTYNRPIEKKNYSGKIYCVTLPEHHLLMVRRNGKAVWSGNSGEFADICDMAMNLEASQNDLTRMDWSFFFFPWWKHPDYELDQPVTIPDEKEEYFKHIEAEAGIELNEPQKAWYYKKYQTQGEEMKREYPSLPEEAFYANIEGAYFGKQMDKVTSDGRITKVPYEPTIPVDTYWDLGISGSRKDSMCVVFCQDVGLEKRIIDFYGASGEGLQHFVNMLQEKREEEGYTYGTHYAPHDIEVKELGTGQSRLEMAAQMGLGFEVLPKLPFADSIESARIVLSRCWFDEQKADELVKALRSFRKEWDDDKGRFKDKPLKDWASDPADAFRMLSIAGDSTKMLASEEKQEEMHQEAQGYSEPDPLNPFAF